LTTLEGEALTYGDFAAQVQAMPLLASSRLIIIRDIFACKNREVLDKIKEDLGKISESTVVIFTQTGEPDKRLGLFKALNKPKISKYFKQVSPLEIIKFIKDEVALRGGGIEPKAAEMLADYVGTDLWQLDNEVEKLTVYCGKRQIEKEDVEKLVSKNVTSNVFEMINDLTAGRKARALCGLEDLLTTGEPPLKILAVVNYQFRSIAQVKEAAEKSQNQYAISKEAGMAPFQVARILPILKNFSWPRIAQIYQKLVQTDLEIKTGETNGAAGLKDFILGF